MALASLDDAFSEYLSLSEQQQRDAVRDGLVVVDTNVLLNLYRFESEPADSLFRVLEILEGRLFVPHQVAREFWRRRRDVISARTGEADDSIETLSNARTRISEVLAQWRRRTGVPELEVERLREGIRGTVDDAIEFIRRRTEATEHHLDPSDDAVLARLRTILAGKVGEAPSEDVASADLIEGLRRVDKRIPPGFGDSTKSGEARAGDYLVWVQALREAKSRTAPYLVLVTEDTEKGDWFEPPTEGKTTGANLGLIREALAEAGTRLVLVRTGRLLDLARVALDVEVAQASIASIDEVSSGNDPWRDSEIATFMDRLESYSPLHARVIQEAAYSGGRITRERVYELGGYDSERTLKGFTRPTATVIRRLVEDGDPDYAGRTEPLVALYESPDSYVQASHFRIPDEFVQWFVSDDES